MQLQVDASVGSNGSSLTLANIKAPKNGYAFIYISNQSNNDVFFDNLQVGIVQGNIAEENHYYSYGLRIATLSSKKLGDSYEGSLKNNYLYQGAYSELDDDIGWNDFALRNYDPQIGRWVQQDPYQEFASPYIGMADDPVNLVDPSGGGIFSGLSAVARVAVTTIGGAIIGGFIGVISGDDDFTGVLIGAGVGLVAGLGSLNIQIMISMSIQATNLAITVINSSVKTDQAGRQAGDSKQTLIIKITIKQSTNSRIINQLEQVVKLKTFRTAWEKSNDEEWEWGFDVTEDENNYYGENLHPGEENTKITPKNHPIVGKFLLGNVHVHYIGLRNAPSPEDIDELREVLTINPKFGVFIIVQAEDAYFALVVTNVEKAKNFFDTHDLNDIAKLIIKPTKKEKDTTKRRIRKIKKALRRNGIRMFKTIDQNKTKFKPA